MKTICAWCKRRLDGEASDSAIVRSLCSECEAAFRVVAELKDSEPPDRSLLNAALEKLHFERREALIYLKAGGGIPVRIEDFGIAITVRYALIGLFPHTGLRLDRYRKNPIVLHEHDYEALPIARSLWERLRDTDRGTRILISKMRFHRDTELSRHIWKELQDGIGYHIELGVLPEKWTIQDGIVSVQKWSLLEISLVKSEETECRPSAEKNG